MPLPSCSPNWHPKRLGQLSTLPPLIPTFGQISLSARDELRQLIAQRRTLVLAGEGSCETLGQAEALARWADQWRLPLLADPLSGLRCQKTAPAVIFDNYDNLFPLADELKPQLNPSVRPMAGIQERRYGRRRLGGRAPRAAGG